MSTKQQSTVNYDSQAQGVYHSLQNPLQGVLQKYMANPLQSTFFNQNVGMGQRQISGQASSAMQSMLSNMRGSGMPGSTTSPFMQSMIRQQGRATAGAQSNNFLQNLNQSRQAQQWATGQAQAYSPLMTGQTQTTGGLGTWLPQMIGALGGAAMGAATGGASTAMGGLGAMTKSVNSLPIGNPSSFMNIGAMTPQVQAFGGGF